MKTNEIENIPQGVFRWKDRLASITLCTLVLGAGVCGIVHAAPPGYRDDPTGKPPSSGCDKTTYQDGIYLPISQVKHNYVLLLIFGNPTDGIAAGKVLFHADDPTTANGSSAPETASCMPDPDALEALNQGVPATQVATAVRGTVMPKWGMIVLGGCPSDCTGPGLYSTFAAKSFQKKNGKTARVDRKISKDPDPLVDMDPSIHWGLMFAADDDWEAPGVMVWQIRVKDALHAARIMKYLCDQNLTNYHGYIGHLMIGYKPGSET